MKKLIALLLALVMVMTVFAACGKEETPAQDDVTEEATEEVTEEATEEVTEEVTDEVMDETASDVVDEIIVGESTASGSLEILEKVWALYGDDEKFPATGGDMSNYVDGAPGAFNVKDGDALTYQLLVPADQLGAISEAASLCHMMNMNTFTCGVFHVGGVVGAAFADAMYNAIKGNQWMCGFPDRMLVSIVSGEYVLVAFGINDAMDPFEAKFQEAYPEAQIVYNEAIG